MQLWSVPYRSSTYLSFLQLAYIGGALLFREMPATAIERVITFYDARVVLGHEAGYIKPVVWRPYFSSLHSYWRRLEKHVHRVIFRCSEMCSFRLVIFLFTSFGHENNGLFNLVVSVSVPYLFSISSVLCNSKSTLLYAYNNGEKTQYTCITNDNWHVDCRTCYRNYRLSIHFQVEYVSSLIICLLPFCCHKESPFVIMETV